MDYINVAVTILLIGIIFAFVYLPKKREEKVIRKMQDNLKVGDKIITYSGLSGKITKIEENEKVLIGLYPSNIEISVEKWAIAGIED